MYYIFINIKETQFHDVLYFLAPGPKGDSGWKGQTGNQGGQGLRGETGSKGSTGPKGMKLYLLPLIALTASKQDLYGKRFLVLLVDLCSSWLVKPISAGLTAAV